MSKVSVIILNYNGRAFLEKFLPSVVANTPSGLADIIVADNASTDDSIQFLKERYPDIMIYPFEKNYGFAEGYNIAIKRCESEYVLLLNSDVEVTPGYLEPMVDYMDANTKVAACQPKIMQEGNRDHFEKAGAAGGLIDVLGYPFCRGRIMDYTEKDEGQYDDIANIFWASGACMLVRRLDFIDYGGFDPEFFAHQEEIDLCFRFNARGRLVVAIPQCVVYHVGGGTLNYEDPRKTYFNFRNNLLLLYKNLKPQYLLPIAVIRLIMDYLAAFVFLLTGKPAHCKAVFKARFDFIRMKGRFKAQRKKNIEVSIAKRIPSAHVGSIVFEYYILHKRKL